jgi:hypothetical protein
MPNSLANLPGVAFVRTIALLYGLFLAGCACCDLASDAAPADADANWSSQLREPTPTGQLLGTDERSREIERRLGVR